MQVTYISCYVQLISLTVVIYASTKGSLVSTTMHLATISLHKTATRSESEFETICSKQDTTV